MIRRQPERTQTVWNSLRAVLQQPKLLFPAIVAGAIAISLVLVAISMVLYNQSGAAQLDLSRPSYEAVRSQAQQTDALSAFEAPNGPLTEEDFDRFEAHFKDIYEGSGDDDTYNMKHYRRVFTPDVLSDSALGISVESE